MDEPGWGWDRRFCTHGVPAPNHLHRPALWLGLDSVRRFPWGEKDGDPGCVPRWH